MPSVSVNRQGGPCIGWQGVLTCTLLHPTPYTLHPAPCILHPSPYTLHPPPYTLLPTPNTPHAKFSCLVTPSFSPAQCSCCPGVYSIAMQKALTVIKKKRRDYVQAARVQKRTVFVPRHSGCRANSAHTRQATLWLEPLFRQKSSKTCKLFPPRSEAATTVA